MRTVRVPAPFVPLFEQAEGYVEDLFKTLSLQPEKGTIHVGNERYVLVRGESLFVTLYDQLTEAFGSENAYEFVYNMARVIGRADSENFTRARGITEPDAKLSTGPVHFAYAGWAFVDILADSRPSPDQGYYLHYYHPNTFESEIIKRRHRTATTPMCYFSAGYSAGWCSAAYGIEVHAREMQCTGRGDPHCEFVMAPYEKLDAAVDLAKAWK